MGNCKLPEMGAENQLCLEEQHVLLTAELLLQSNILLLKKNRADVIIKSVLKAWTFDEKCFSNLWTKAYF